MALARALSVSLLGLEGHVVEVEADLGIGLPGVRIIGLPDTTLREAHDRVRAAVINSGQDWPNRRITVALSPADLPKRGSGFDLALAVSVLAANDAIPAERLHGIALVGELALDGRVRPIRGLLPATLAASRAGVERIVVPRRNAREARLVPGMDVLAVGSLRELVGWVLGEPLDDDDEESLAADELDDPARLDLADVAGQQLGRRALEIAAAGAHHLFLLGPPGAGKTMLAERLPGLLPPLDVPASLEVTAIHSVAGALEPHVPLVRVPPFRSPHHTATVVSLVGGGSGMPRPGAVSLAHRGVLFLDEAPEFAPVALEALRQPLESGHVTIARAAGLATYPARFSLVLAANPCPCALSSGRPGECTCRPEQRRKYLGRLSGALMDRIDLRVTLPPVTRAALAGETGPSEPTSAVAARVLAARERAALRLIATPWRTNAEVPGPFLRRTWPLPAAALAPARDALDRGRLTGRGYDRVLRIAWTLADLAGNPAPDEGDVAEACSLRVAAA